MAELAMIKRSLWWECENITQAVDVNLLIVSVVEGLEVIDNLI
jgi:hypothetical protein